MIFRIFCSVELLIIIKLINLFYCYYKFQLKSLYEYAQNEYKPQILFITINNYSWASLRTMDLQQVKQIFQMTSQLQQAFRSIRTLCGKLIDSQNPQKNSNKNIQNGINRQAKGRYNSTHGQQRFEQSKYESQSSVYAPKRQQMMNNRPSMKPLTKTIQIPSNLISNSSHQVQRVRVPTQSAVLNGPMSPYLIFFQRKRDQIAKDYPQLNGQELKGIMSQVWKSFNTQQRLPYQQEYQKLKNNLKTKTNEVERNNSNIVQSVRNQVTHNQSTYNQSTHNQSTHNQSTHNQSNNMAKRTMIRKN